MMTRKDIFLCHASEDKPAVVKPLFQAMTVAGISCWLDEAEIHWGDSITHKVNEGLTKSRYVIVVLSQAFLSKHWPQRELNAALNIEASTGEVRVLPLLIGDPTTKEKLKDTFSLMNDKLYLSWDGSTHTIIAALQQRLSKPLAIRPAENVPILGSTDQSHYFLPTIKKRITQRDKDIFLKESFQAIKSYFQQALVNMENHYPAIETDFTEVHHFKFVAKVYVNGDVAAQCKIWIGGMLNSNSIGYYSGNVDFSNDNSFSGRVSVDDGGDDLYLNVDTFSFDLSSAETKSLAPAKAAELLWRHFIHPVERSR